MAKDGVERLFKGRDRVVLLEVLAQGIQRVVQP
jgi:hypothetical protein